MDTIEIIYWAACFAGIALAAVCAALSFYHARKNDGSLMFYLLAGFQACIALSGVYYLLAWFVAEYPYVISPGDLTWVGALVFLITAALDSMDKWTVAQKDAAKKYRLPAMAAPAICIIFNFAYIRIYPEIIANFLLIFFPLAILACFTLWLMLAGLKGGINAELRPYHIAILAFVVSQLFTDLFSSLGWDYGYAVHYTVCFWFQSLMAPAIYFAYFTARKAAAV